MSRFPALIAHIVSIQKAWEQDEDHAISIGDQHLARDCRIRAATLEQLVRDITDFSEKVA